MEEKIAILHINDLHSHLEMIPDLNIKLNNRKEELKNQGYEVITVDIGDCCDRSHPLTEYSLGEINIELLNYLQVNFFTIGNNEGLGLPKKRLLNLYDNADGICVLGNLYDGSNLAPFAKKYAIYETDNSQKIAFIGLTAAYPMSYSPLGWNIKDPLLELENIYNKIVGKVDQIILLSHLGYPTDQKIAKEYPLINVIIGGHTHHLLENGQKINNTLLSAAGKYGNYFGEILLDKKQALTYSVRPDQKVYEQLINDGYQKLQTISYSENQNIIEKYKLVSKITDSFLKKFDCDFCILNDGLCIDNLKTGLVTKATLHQLFPHPMHLMTVELKGLDLKRLFFEIDKNQSFLRNFQLKGFGFRGKVFGEIIISSNDIHEIENEKIYKLITVDHYHFIPFFPTIAYAGKCNIMMDKFLREQVAEVIDEIVK